jgi:hypothetical protein
MLAPLIHKLAATIGDETSTIATSFERPLRKSASRLFSGAQAFR